MYEKTDLSWRVLKNFVLSQPDKEYSAISPSSLGGCMRSHYWKIKGLKSTTPPGPGALVNFRVGHHWEEELAKAYDHAGLLVKWFVDGTDAPWYDEETGLGGTPDLIVRTMETGGEEAIVDSKTVMSAWFKYASKYKSFDDWVADNMNYVFQQVAYVLLARKNGYPDLNKAILSFGSKDDGYIGMEVQITVTKGLAKMVLDRTAILKGYLDANTLPPCECEGWKIGYCGYGNPNTLVANAKKKMINSECCQEAFVAA